MVSRCRQRDLALGCLHTRAQSGDVSAQWVYAQWLSWDSKRGYRPMRGRARTWLERAAGGGHPDALHELGHLVYPQSPSRAIELYERAARQGSALAPGDSGRSAPAGGIEAVPLPGFWCCAVTLSD